MDNKTKKLLTDIIGSINNINSYLMPGVRHKCIFLK